MRPQTPSEVVGDKGQLSVECPKQQHLGLSKLYRPPTHGSGENCLGRYTIRLEIRGEGVKVYVVSKIARITIGLALSISSQEAHSTERISSISSPRPTARALVPTQAAASEDLDLFAACRAISLSPFG